MWKSEFDLYVDHYSRYQKSSKAQSDLESHIQCVDSDIGRNVGFNRIAIHHVVLPPGCRTSSPHAESLEEEFVYVLKGNPHLWLNGFIHDLREGHAVGFPAGTGIAHTLINNTDCDVHLLVAGEKTKKENLCSFPINPELRENCPIWWENPPEQNLGPHLGLPGPIRPEERAMESSACFIDCFSQTPGRAFHYPGDSETFGHGFRITDKIGLKALGIWYEVLPPGRRAAFPHAHTHEEEFIFVLKGKPTVWLDGYSQEISKDHFAAFPSNTGIAHTLINNTNENVVYLCIGETAEFSEEKISYPLHPLRQKECIRKGRYWTDLAPRSFGPDEGAPATSFQDHMKLKFCTLENATEVYEVFKQSRNYFLKVDGCEPTLAIAEKAIVDGPKNRAEKYFKEFLLIQLNGEGIGVLDLHAHHPEEGICYLGLLLLKENFHSKGLGAQCFRFAEDYVKRALGCSRIRLGVHDDNNVSGFWKKMGFRENGKTYEWKGEGKTSLVREYDKDI